MLYIWVSVFLEFLNLLLELDAPLTKMKSADLVQVSSLHTSTPLHMLSSVSPTAYTVMIKLTLRLHVKLCWVIRSLCDLSITWQCSPNSLFLVFYGYKTSLDWTFMIHRVKTDCFVGDASSFAEVLFVKKLFGPLAILSFNLIIYMAYTNCPTMFTCVQHPPPGRMLNQPVSWHTQVNTWGFSRLCRLQLSLLLFLTFLPITVFLREFICMWLENIEKISNI